MEFSDPYSQAQASSGSSTSHEWSSSKSGEGSLPHRFDILRHTKRQQRAVFGATFSETNESIHLSSIIDDSSEVPTSHRTGSVGMAGEGSEVDSHSRYARSYTVNS